MTDDRARFVEELTQHLKDTVGYPWSSAQYAEAVAVYLETRREDGYLGWLTMDGQIRRVNTADRFGPAMWEVHCDPRIEDYNSWRGTW